MQEIKLIVAESPKGFTEQVNLWLENGWKLSGGVAVVNNHDIHRTYFYQVVYREPELTGAQD